MWTGALALIGVPILSGFWSKDDIIVLAFQSGQYILFAVALGTVILTSFYSIRFMGMIFYRGEKKHEDPDHREDHIDQPEHEHEQKEPGWTMVLPYGILAALTIAIGLIGPLVSGFLIKAFSTYYANSLHLSVAESVSSSSVLSGLGLEIGVAIGSVIMLLIGGFTAYRFYIAHKSSPEAVVAKSPGLQGIYKFLWNRWYIDAIYQKVFVNTTLAILSPIERYIERPIDKALNEGIPDVFKALNKGLRKIQTGVSSFNMLYFIVFIALLLLALWLGGLL